MTESQQLQEHATSRKLATLQRIAEVHIHPNADNLDIVRVLGWDVVVGRGEYKPGDLTVFFEIDSVVPPVAEFEFLANKNFRVKTIRLRGKTSQGLCVKPKILADSAWFDDFFDLNAHLAIQRVNLDLVGDVYGFRDSDGRVHVAEVGCDLTGALHVEKYVPPIPACLSGTVKGNFPSFIPKTDETRAQSDPSLFTDLYDRPVAITEKLEGTSMTVYWYQGNFGVCSRSWELKRDESVYWTTAQRLQLENIAINGFAIQGEIIGPGIQGNIYKLARPEWYVFGIWNINTAMRLSHDEMTALCESIGLQTVPVVIRQQPDQTLGQMFKTLADVMEYTEGTSILNPNTQREGIVIKPLYEFSQTRNSFKAINPNYLL